MLNCLKIEINLIRKKWASYLYRTATTTYPCCVPTLGDSAGAGRTGLARRKSNKLLIKHAIKSKKNIFFIQQVMLLLTFVIVDGYMFPLTILNKNQLL